MSFFRSIIPTVGSLDGRVIAHTAFVIGAEPIDLRATVTKPSPSRAQRFAPSESRQRTRRAVGAARVVAKLSIGIGAPTLNRRGRREHGTVA